MEEESPLEESEDVAEDEAPAEREEEDSAEAVTEEESGEEGADAKNPEKSEDKPEGKSDPSGSAENRTKKFRKKRDERDEKIAELSDKLLRQMAEFDNFRKRTEKEKSSMYVIGAKDIIEKLLPIVDNFERGLSGVPEERKEDAFVTGMEMVYKQLMAMLESVGVKSIEAVGKEFDPDLHNAVMHVEDEEYGENTVVEELQKGYTYRDIVVRHSMVKVAN